MRNAFEMTPAEIHSSAEGLRLLARLSPLHQSLTREHRDQGLDPDAAYRRASADLLDEYGDDLVAAIRNVHDRRVRTRRGALGFLLRDAGLKP